MSKAAFVIVTYNSEKWIKRVLNSIQNTEIFLIDNNSSDNTKKVISEFPKAQVIALEKNLGFATANNIGIQKAYDEGAQYFFLLNHDAWIQEGTIARLIQLSKANPEYGILSPIHLNGSGELLDWNFTNYISNQEDDGRKLYTDLLLKKEFKNIYDVNFVNAAAWLITRECIEKVGLFDAQLLPHYGEDLNYSQRVLYQGLKIGVAPDTFIYHDREDRSGNHIKNNFGIQSDHRDFKTKGANILDETATEWMNDQISFDYKQSLKELLKGKLKGFKTHRQNFKEKTLLKNKILEHREQYLKKGFGLKSK